jgi:hypothetical protein
MPRGAPCRSARCPSGEGSGHRTGPCSSNSGQELSAVETGVRILPRSITLLLAAVGIPKLFPDVSPRRVVKLAFSSLFVGIVVLVAALDVGAGPEVVTWPLLLAGLGIGALASQLGGVTVSAVPDEQSAEVGGLQNTVTKPGCVRRNSSRRGGPDLGTHQLVLVGHRGEP